MKKHYEVITPETGGVIKAWTKGVLFEEEAKRQLANLAQLPFLAGPIAVMPDVHAGKGSTIGSIIPTVKAVIPAAVGVDIGCGMMAVRTSLKASDLPDNLKAMRTAIEKAVPVGFGKWGDDLPDSVRMAWMDMRAEFNWIKALSPKIEKSNSVVHLGTLGGGNHFIELCLDEEQAVWVMLHSGSRGVGNAIGQHFIEQARKEMERWMINLPDKDLAYLPEGSEHFCDYVDAVEWAQSFATLNREVMMANVLMAIKPFVPPFTTFDEAVNCHHNYISREHHGGRNIYVTRKGAVRAGKDEMGIIPGSMGAKSFIVRGLGNEESYCSCSHGAGRVMSRTKAKATFTAKDHAKATEGVECRKDDGVIDETPAAYKNIDDVMAAQADLVEIVHTLKQVLCVKG